MSIMEMNVQEMAMISRLSELATEAIEASELIKRSFRSGFGFGNEEIEVYQTSSFGEYYGHGYLTIDGIFKYRDNWWGGRYYEFRCDAEGIYRLFRSCFLRDNGLEELDPEVFDCNIENIGFYFREFISQLKEKEEKGE